MTASDRGECMKMKPGKRGHVRTMCRDMPLIRGAFSKLDQYHSEGTRDFFEVLTRNTGKTKRAKEHSAKAAENDLKYANGKKLREGPR